MKHSEKIYIVKQAYSSFLKALTKTRDLPKKPGVWSVDGKTQFKKLTPPEYNPAPKNYEGHFGTPGGNPTQAQQARRLIFEALLSGSRK